MGDTQLAMDAYGTDTFMVGFDALSYSKIDGTNVTKRAVSVAPTVTLPSRGALKIADQVYLFGHAAPDFWKGEVIRNTVIIQGADGLANLTTIGDALSGTAPTTAYAAAVFSKYVPVDASSKYPPQFQIFLSGTESAQEDSLIELGGTYYFVKQSYRSTSGLLIALSNVVENTPETPCFETVSLGSRTYDPILDAYTTTGAPTNVFRIKWSESFEYLSVGTTAFQRGDMQVFVPSTLTPKSGDILPLSDGSWKILSVQKVGTTWRCHVRRS